MAVQIVRLLDRLRISIGRIPQSWSTATRMERYKSIRADGERIQARLKQAI